MNHQSQRFGLSMLILIGLSACGLSQTSEQINELNQPAGELKTANYRQHSRIVTTPTLEPSSPTPYVENPNYLLCGNDLYIQATSTPIPYEPLPYEPRRIRLSRADEGSKLELKRGDILEIRLASSPSIGLKWVTSPKLKILQQLPSLEFEPSSTLSEAEGFETLVFEAVAVGSSGVGFTHQRIMDTNEPYYLFGFFVTITEP
ncbi:protease inhibitor I42 family protein [Herpetosiphon llansteffanensis]